MKPLAQVRILLDNCGLRHVVQVRERHSIFHRLDQLFLSIHQGFVIALQSRSGIDEVGARDVTATVLLV